MKGKKPILIVLALVVFLLVGVWASRGAESKLSHSLAIAKLLQPLLEEEERTMEVSLLASIHDTPILLESEVSLVRAGERSYLRIEREGTAVYLTDNLLLLENGKTFRIGERQQAQAASYKGLLPYIGTLYEGLDITARENGDESIYSVAVTGEQMKPLLEAASLGTSLPLESIKKLNVSLPELSRTAGTLTEGSLTILLDRDRVASMEVSIQGKINALIASIPMKLTAGFHFA